ncbi:MAG: pyridoxamine 5'-phosphate oxidase family protein [Candidatus Diapherotrites archaeon]|uniref:Pyridoxamine 5'-phosphate oxidase family protein n=1 Tax=Candidatus Iainarchaeum sp. TaxID=3101447 RepID=A0A8T5GE84_9ARCH|nr:pyridoxamine 5'-phosphate oxidase family protein [Candidatus Diapherotrites archaeon]
MINEELKQLIESNPLSFSTINKTLAPHIIYVMYAKVIDKNKILITDNYMEKTKQNILYNNKVSLSVLVGEVAFEIIGTAKYFEEGNYFDQVKNMPENKEEPCKGAIVVSVEKIVKMG